MFIGGNIKMLHFKEVSLSQTHTISLGATWWRWMCGWRQRMETFSISNFRNLSFLLLFSYSFIPLCTIATVSHLSGNTTACAIRLSGDRNSISVKWQLFISVTSETHNLFFYSPLPNWLLVDPWSKIHSCIREILKLAKVQNARFPIALSLYNRRRDKFALKETCICWCP